MKSLVLIVSLLFLSGCGGGGSTTTSDTEDMDHQSSNKNSLATIKTFDVKGTSEKNSNGQIPISSTLNNGEWSIDWEINLKEVELNNFFQIKMYVSEDNVLSANDPEVYLAVCTGTQCIGDTKISLSCIHDGLLPDCNQDLLGGVFESHNMEPFLDKRPKSGYLIFTVAGIDALIDDKLTTKKYQAVIFE